MTDASRPIVAPATNEAGIRSAFQQINHTKRPGWNLKYDRRTDTLYLRAPNHGPCISYWLPNRPEIMLRLNVHTGDLEGIDFTDYRAVLEKTDPVWRRLRRGVHIATWMERLGLMRGAARKEQAATERIREQTQRFCPT